MTFKKARIMLNGTINYILISRRYDASINHYIPYILKLATTLRYIFCNKLSLLIGRSNSLSIPVISFILLHLMIASVQYMFNKKYNIFTSQAIMDSVGQHQSTSARSSLLRIFLVSIIVD